MKFYVDFLIVDSLNEEQRKHVFMFRLTVWQLLRCRGVAQNFLRGQMYAKVESLPSKDRQKYLRQVYEPNLKKIISDDALIQRIKQAALRMKFDVTTDRNKLTVSLRDDDLTDVVHVVYGDAAFRGPKMVGRCNRPVFVHRTSGEHYVKDDFGVLTKRYAFRSCSKTQYNEFLQRKTSREENDKHLLSPISDRVLNSHLLKHAKPTHKKAIYIHQRYGSGEEQRGVCLSTTPHCIVSDQGLGFGGGEPVRICVDLARIHHRPFFNLYENPSEWIGLAYYRYKKNKPPKLTFTPDQTKEALLLSMIKNTELYLETMYLTDVADVYKWSTSGVWKLLYHDYDETAPRPALPQEPPPAIFEPKSKGGLERRK